MVAADVARQVPPPAPPLRVPRAVSVERVEALPAAAATVAPYGLRDRALLELLYGTAALDRYLLRGRPALTAAGRGGSAVFLNARGGGLSRRSGWAIVKTAAERAKLSADISPHTLGDPSPCICSTVGSMSGLSGNFWVMPR
jgi:integrase/recombinase XerD